MTDGTEEAKEGEEDTFMEARIRTTARGITQRVVITIHPEDTPISESDSE